LITTHGLHKLKTHQIGGYRAHASASTIAKTWSSSMTEQEGEMQLPQETAATNT
jgi:hypothetical protein